MIITPGYGDSLAIPFEDFAALRGRMHRLSSAETAAVAINRTPLKFALLSDEAMTTMLVRDRLLSEPTATGAAQ